METKIRVMLVDDHEVVRVGLYGLLSLFPHIEVVAEAANAEQCARLICQNEPDILLMDIRLPGKTGITACRELKQEFPALQVIMLTSYDDKAYIQDALAAGASGYVLKEIGAQELIQTIETVFQGATRLSPTVMAKLTENGKEAPEQARLLADLTEQEKQVLLHLSSGRTNREIAELMDLREKTVRNYVSVVLEKLQVHNRTEAAAFVYRYHLEP